ncbi:MAG: serine hydrolase, partial [Candidatus Latescibacterota bacterium]
KPLGMRDSFFATTPEIPAPFANGYEHMSGIPSDCTVYEPSALGAANAVVSTPFDMFRFYRELFQGHTLLTKRSLKLMALLSDATLEEDSYGLGLMERLSNRGTWRGCISSIRGYSVMAGYYMQGRTFVMIFANTGENIAAVEELFNDTLRRISGCPTDMLPADNTAVAAGNGQVRLSWQAGFLYGDTYRVYIGPTWNSVHEATADKLNDVTMIETDSAVFNAAVKTLKSGKTYYWRVEAVRKRPAMEMENARKWRDKVRQLNKQLPWIPIPEMETVTGPVFSIKVQ